MRSLDFSKFPELLNIRDGTLPEIVCLIKAREWERMPGTELDKSLFDPESGRELDESEFQILNRLSEGAYQRSSTDLVPWSIKIGDDRATFWYSNETNTTQLVFQGGYKLTKIVYEKGYKKWERPLKDFEELREIASNHYEMGSRIHTESIRRTVPQRDTVLELPPLSLFEEHFYRPLPLDMALRFYYQREG